MPGDKAAGHHSLDFLGLSRGSRTCAPVSSLIEARIGAGVVMMTLILLRDWDCDDDDTDTDDLPHPPYWAPHTSWEKGPGNIDQLRENKSIEENFDATGSMMGEVIAV